MRVFGDVRGIVIVSIACSNGTPFVGRFASVCCIAFASDRGCSCVIPFVVTAIDISCDRIGFRSSNELTHLQPTAASTGFHASRKAAYCHHDWLVFLTGCRSIQLIRISGFLVARGVGACQCGAVLRGCPLHTGSHFFRALLIPACLSASFARVYTARFSALASLAAHCSWCGCSGRRACYSKQRINDDESCTAAAAIRTSTEQQRWTRSTR
jgi:hypothetical protein